MASSARPGRGAQASSHILRDKGWARSLQSMRHRKKQQRQSLNTNHHSSFSSHIWELAVSILPASSSVTLCQRAWLDTERETNITSHGKPSRLTQAHVSLQLAVATPQMAPQWPRNVCAYWREKLVPTGASWTPCSGPLACINLNWAVLWGR